MEGSSISYLVVYSVLANDYASTSCTDPFQGNLAFFGASCSDITVTLTALAIWILSWRIACIYFGSAQDLLHLFARERFDETSTPNFAME
jgi:hypothetical protein